MLLVFISVETRSQCVTLTAGSVYYKSNTGAAYDSVQLVVSQCNAANYDVYNNGMLYAPGYVVTVTGSNPTTNTGSKKVAILPNVAYMFQVKTTDGSCFSNFLAFTLPTVLPVKLLSFVAHTSGNKVTTSWIVESDQEADHYLVERSTDARNFTGVQLQFAANQSSRQTYTLSTNDVPTGIYYYRLKMVNKNGFVEYSNIVRVEIGSKKSDVSITVAPNPVVNQLTLRLDGKVLTTEKVRILDMFGKVVLSTSNQPIINVQNLSAGAYVVEILSKNGQTNRTKFIKE